MPKIDCPYNPGVNCPESGRHCAQCGWSPEVARRRRASKSVVASPTEIPPSRHKGGRPRQVAKINEAGDVLELYSSLTAAADANNMTPTSVKYHCQGKLKHPFKCTGGYSFLYAD